MSQQTAIVNKLLTNVSNGLFPEGHIAEKVFPKISVKQKSGLIGAYGNNHIRLVDDLIGGQSEARRVTPISRSNSPYVIMSHALEGLVTPDDYANVEQPYDAEADETLGVTSLLLTNKERALASQLFNTGVITNNATPGTKFDNYTSSDPLLFFKQAQDSIYDLTGKKGNAAIMSRVVYNTLKYHPQILDILGFKYNQIGLLSEADIAKAMDVDQLLIADAIYNNSVEGQADSIAPIWGDSILVYVKPQAAAKYQVSFGYEMNMAGRGTRQVYKSPVHNPPGSTSIIVQDDYSFELTNVNAAYLLDNVLT